MTIYQLLYCYSSLGRGSIPHTLSFRNDKKLWSESTFCEADIGPKIEVHFIFLFQRPSLPRSISSVQSSFLLYPPTLTQLSCLNVFFDHELHSRHVRYGETVKSRIDEIVMVMCDVTSTRTRGL